MDQIIRNQPTAIDRLKDAWNENPLLVIGVATGACMAIAKLIEAVSGVQGRRAYARQIKMKAGRAK
jgi:hypoxanthine-guanine phosphoribosyltransferase